MSKLTPKNILGAINYSLFTENKKKKTNYRFRKILEKEVIEITVACFGMPLTSTLTLNSDGALSLRFLGEVLT